MGSSVTANTAGVEWGSCVGGNKSARVGWTREAEQQTSGLARSGRIIGRVLRELDHEPIAVATEGVVLLGVGILEKPGRRGGP